MKKIKDKIKKFLEDPPILFLIPISLFFLIFAVIFSIICITNINHINPTNFIIALISLMIGASTAILIFKV